MVQENEKDPWETAQRRKKKETLSKIWGGSEKVEG